VGAVLLLPLSFLSAFLTVSYLDATLNVAFVNLRPGFVETLVLAIGEVELFPAAVAGGDQYMDMGIVGICMEGIEGGIGFELGGFKPLPGHTHRLVPIHGAIKAQDSPVVASLTAALLGEFTEEICNAAALIVAGDAEVFFVWDVACFPKIAGAGTGDVHGVSPGGAGSLADGDLAEGAHGVAGPESDTPVGGWRESISFWSLTRQRERERRTSPRRSLPALRW